MFCRVQIQVNLPGCFHVETYILICIFLGCDFTVTAADRIADDRLIDHVVIHVMKYQICLRNM